MISDQENVSKRGDGNFFCESMELYYKAKNDSITKHATYLKALQILKEYDQEEEETSNNDDDDGVDNDNNDNDPISINSCHHNSVDFWEGKLKSTQQKLKESEMELKSCLEQPSSDRMAEMLDFDLSALSAKVTQVKSSVDNLNRNIEMMCSNRNGNREANRIPVDEEKLHKANLLIENLLKITKRE